MELGLGGAVVLVVGGRGYLGREIARQFALEGAQVIIASRDAAGLAAAAAEAGPGVRPQRLDAASADSVAEAIDAVAEEFGHIDVLVDCAAPSARTLDTARSSDPELVLEATAAKAIGYLRVANAVLPGMIARGSGRIVFVSGQNAQITGNLAGSVRNGAVAAIAKNLADAAAGTGVTVNTIHPGIVVDKPNPVPLPGRFGETSPAQVAAVAVFLGSRPAAGISGEVIAVGHRLMGVI